MFVSRFCGGVEGLGWGVHVWVGGGKSAGLSRWFGIVS